MFLGTSYKPWGKIEPVGQAPFVRDMTKLTNEEPLSLQNYKERRAERSFMLSKLMKKPAYLKYNDLVDVTKTTIGGNKFHRGAKTTFALVHRVKGKSKTD